MKKLRKMDEMELFITTKALRLAYFYTVLFLFIWSLVDYFITKRFSSIAFFLLITQNIIFIFSKMHFEKKATASNEKSTFTKY